ncbi:phage major capsid protein [Gordonia sp. MMO-8]|uniref:phage major capsid protein n=1 Tax=Gordonia sp. MMO-8 TaxID=3127886 RepID=UPI00301B00D7
MAVNTPDVASGWRPDQIHYFDADKILGESLYVSATTKGGEIQGDAPSLLVPYVDDADSAAFVAEGAEITEDDPDLDQVQVFTRKIARLVKLSREQFGQDGTAANISASVKNDLIRKMDRALLSQVAPTAPAVAPVAGLVNTTGLVNGGEITTDLDPLIDLLVQLQANDAAPRVIVVDPLAFGALAKLRKGEGSNEGLLTGANDALTFPLLGTQVSVSSAMPASAGVVIDPAAIISAYSQVEIATSDQAYFTSDSVAVRATVRVGHKVVRPARLGKFTVEAA